MSILEIFESVVDNNFADILWSVFWKEANLSELAPNGGELASQNFPPLARRFSRKSQFEIAHPDSTKSAVTQVNQLSDPDAERSR
jgi:hypothetical protein